jgi:hypothetical protein
MDKNRQEAPSHLCRDWGLCLLALTWCCCCGERNEDPGPDVHLLLDFSSTKGCSEEGVQTIALVLATDRSDVLSCNVLSCLDDSGAIADLARGDYAVYAFASDLVLSNKVILYGAKSFHLESTDKDIGPLKLQKGSLNLNLVWEAGESCSENNVEDVLVTFQQEPEYGDDIASQLAYFDAACADLYGISLYQSDIQTQIDSPCLDSLEINPAPLGKYHVSVQGYCADSACAPAEAGAEDAEFPAYYGSAAVDLVPETNSVDIYMLKQ